MIERVKLTGFSPDSEENNPAILVDSQAVYPTSRGAHSMSIPELRATAPVIEYNTGKFKYPQVVGCYNAEWLSGASSLFAVSELTKAVDGTTVNGAAFRKNSDGTWTILNYQRDSGATTGTVNTINGAGGTFSNVDQTFELEYDDYISMDQYGDYVFVATGATPFVIKNDGTIADTAFAGINAPNAFKPKFVARSGSFVFLASQKGTAADDAAGLNMDETYWRCSISGVFTGTNPDFTVDDGTLGNQCVANNVRETPGPIVAMKSLDRSMVIYKSNSVYLLSYVGPPVVWSQFLLTQEAGPVSANAVVDIGGKHAFMGDNDFYLVQGNSVTTLPNTLKEFLLGPEGDVDSQRKYGVFGYYDREKMCVFWHYPSVSYAPFQIDKEQGKPVCDKWVCWNFLTNTWTRGSGAQQASDNSRVSKLYLDYPCYPYLTPGDALTYFDLGGASNLLSGVTPTWSQDFGTLIYADAKITGTTKISSGYFTNFSYWRDENIPVKRDSEDSFRSGKISDYTNEYAIVKNSLYGEPETPQDGVESYIRTGDFGDGITYKFVRGIRPVYSGKYPVSFSRCTVYTRETLDTDWREEEVPIVSPAGSTKARTDTPYWINVRSNARYHQFKIEYTGMGEISGLDIDFVEMGSR